jgi:hypothetical protein
MTDSPVVLLLVRNADEREIVRRRLIELEVTPIVVRAGRAVAAIEEFHPIAAVMDRPHAATAPEDFLESTCTNRIRLVTLPDLDVFGAESESLLQWAITPPVPY